MSKGKEEEKSVQNKVWKAVESLSTWSSSAVTWGASLDFLLNFLSCVSGIEPRGNVVLKPAEFLVETVEAGLGEVLVYVEDPEGHTEEVGSHPLISYSIKHNTVKYSWVIVLCVRQARVIPNNDKNRSYSVVYLPKVEGLHKVRNNMEDTPIILQKEIMTLYWFSSWLSPSFSSWFSY